MHRSTLRGGVLCLAIGVGVALANASPDDGPAAPRPPADAAGPATPQAADAAFRARDFATSARLDRELVARDPKLVGAWFRLGSALLELGRHAEAADAFSRAAAAPKLAPTALYNEACARARAADLTAAADALARAVKAGFHDVALLESDADLAALRDRPAFAASLARARENRARLPWRQFDFWVGTWDVRSPDGTPLGRNVISLRQQGRIVHEEWVNAQGTGGGESVNFYDPGRGRWRQVWVDATGGVTEYEGAFTDGAMRLHGRRTAATGTTLLTRATFTPNADGTVRQFLEDSSDGGSVWTPVFDGIYRRAER